MHNYGNHKTGRNGSESSGAALLIALCLIALFLVTGCTTSVKRSPEVPAELTRRPPPEQSLLTPCRDLPDIPDQSQVTFRQALLLLIEVSWAYHDCKGRHQKLVEAVTDDLPPE